MPLSSRSDRWASRIVILLQFTAWISIGVVLLQKGASTLRNRATIEMGKSVQTPEGSAKSADNTTHVFLSEKTKRTIPDEDSFEDRLSDRQEIEENFSSNTDLSPSFTVHRPEKKELSKSNRSIIQNSLNGDQNEDVSSIFQLAFEDSYGGNASVVETEIKNDLTNETDSLSTSLDVAWKKQKLRSRVNSGGAAAAIAMVAIGAAMLIVGPVVIVLRALDKRRQDRRFSKTSRWDDHPPTYEQATLMNEVPRYSTLNLNVIHEVRVSSDASIPLPSCSRSYSPSGSPSSSALSNCAR